MSDEDLYRVAFNAHEWAEEAAVNAIIASLERAPLEALMCLADPDWSWEKRSTISCIITEQASDVLTAKLETMVAA